MENPLSAINSANVLPEKRIAALKSLVSQGDAACGFSKMRGEANIMLKTIFSFSPYTPTMAAFRARKEGLAVAGVSDTNSIAALQEMRAACAVLRIACVSATDFFINLAHTQFFGRIINTPHSPGIVRASLLAFPSSDFQTVADFLIPISQSRHSRNKKTLARLNDFFSAQGGGLLGENPVSYENDVLPLTMSKFGGFATQRHIMASVAKRLAASLAKRDELVRAIRGPLSIALSAEAEARLLDEANPHFFFDLVEVLFEGLLGRFLVRPDDWECVSAEAAGEFVRSTRGILCYFYKGGKNFEDSFLEEIFPYLKEWGFAAVSFAPSTISAAQFARLSRLCKKYEMLQVVGADIYGSRARFSCPLLRKKEFSPLRDNIWALVAHEALSFANKDFGLFSATDPVSLVPFQKRVKLYANVGRQLSPIGVLPASEGMKQLSQDQRDFMAELKAKATSEG